MSHTWHQSDMHGGTGANITRGTRVQHEPHGVEKRYL